LYANGKINNDLKTYLRRIRVLIHYNVRSAIIILKKVNGYTILLFYNVSTILLQ